MDFLGFLTRPPEKTSGLYPNQKGMINAVKKMTKFVKTLAMLACLAVCLWCAGESLQNWARERGGEELSAAASPGRQPWTARQPSASLGLQ